MKRLLLIVLLLSTVPSSGLDKNLKPPGLVLVNGKMWAVKVVKEIKVKEIKTARKEVLLGVTDCSRRTIELRDEEIGLVTQTFWHEVLHAFTCEDGRPHDELYDNPSDMEHPGIYFAAEKLNVFLFANPEVFVWLKKALAEQRRIVQVRQEAEEWIKERK